MHFLVHLSEVMHCPLKNRTANVKVVSPDTSENVSHVMQQLSFFQLFALFVWI